MSAESTVTVEGFTVLPVKVRINSQASHYVFMKEHNVRQTDVCKPRHRTLFVLNVPPYVTQESFEKLFQSCGKVQAVHFHEKPTAGPPDPVHSAQDFFKRPLQARGYKVAYVVFKSPGSVQKALSLPYSEARVLFDKGSAPLTGMRKWTEEYHNGLVKERALQDSIDKYMTEYDARLEQEKQQAKATEGVPDEEGWITVTRHGKNKPIPRTEAHEKRALAREKKRRKKRELLNFYAFQARETKREYIANLRKKFEEDKQRVAQMKAARKFRPF